MTSAGQKKLYTEMNLVTFSERIQQNLLNRITDKIRSNVQEVAVFKFARFETFTKHSLVSNEFIEQLATRMYRATGYLEIKREEDFYHRALVSNHNSSLRNHCTIGLNEQKDKRWP